jgi:hypothetical protein
VWKTNEGREHLAPGKIWQPDHVEVNIKMPYLLREVGIKTHTRWNDIQPLSRERIRVIAAFEEGSVSIIHIQAPEAILHISQPPPPGRKRDKAAREESDMHMIKHRFMAVRTVDV